MLIPLLQVNAFAQAGNLLQKGQKLYIGEIRGMTEGEFKKQPFYGNDFGLPPITKSSNLIEIRCYESSVNLVNHCTILRYDTAFSISRKVIQYRPYDTSKYVLTELQPVAAMNPDTIFRKMVELGVFSFLPEKYRDKKRMIINSRNQLEPSSRLIGVTDGISYRIDIKIGDTYKSIYTNSTEKVQAPVFPDDTNLQRNVKVALMLEAKPALLVK
ncbi:MAG: hypothetical protein NTW29_06240 [Bacteroidetes bacterium]|nr:hypothetical protein [Bacteroidota bacterium]